MNIELINLYWNVRAYITRQLANAVWGEKTVDELADFIQSNQPDLKGFNRRGLYRMKQFYETYSSIQFVSPLMAQLQPFANKEDIITSSAMTQFRVDDIRESILAKVSWTHHLTLISRTKTIEECEFYLKLAIQEKYSVKELDRQISVSLYERTMLESPKLSALLGEMHPNITASVKDSYVFEFLGLPESHSENDLQKGLVGQLKKFILELGKDFLLVGEEYRIQVGNSDFCIDLLFYHRGLQCLVAFELKTDKFQPEYLGKLNFYLEALDRDVKKSNENPSIGVLLCKDRGEVVEYALSRTLSPTMVSKYHTQLPDKKLLQKKLRELFEQ
ncbi:MAG: PDDEXK nuclease domain-containing protein [Planctomycetaceae bacterium]|nr:PDDEXK nuclease domain-containing protein [Planctomycetaceae bacterium]